MKLRTLVASAAVFTVAAGLAAPAAGAAVGTDSTTVTVSLGGGSFTIDAPATATGSGSVSPLSTVSVSLSDTTVTDNRGTLLGWGITASSSGLTGSGTATGSSIANTNMLWATGTVAVGTSGANLLGSLTGITTGAGGSLAAAAPVAVAAVGAGGGVYTYPATVTVTVPVNAVAGDYTGDVVQTAL